MAFKMILIALTQHHLDKKRIVESVFQEQQRLFHLDNFSLSILQLLTASIYRHWWCRMRWKEQPKDIDNKQKKTDHQTHWPVVVGKGLLT